MIGNPISEFIDDLYCNPEMEMEYHGVRYLVSGYRDADNEYVLQIDTIEPQSSAVFFVKKKTVRECVEAFEEATLFDGKTIYEAENEITVLYG